MKPHHQADQLTVHDQLEQPAKRAGKRLAEQINQCDRHVLFLSSGGSSLQILEYLPTEILSDMLTVGVLDERVTDTKDKRNSYQLLRTAFGASIPNSPTQFLDITQERPTNLEVVQTSFSQQLRDWHVNHPGGKVLATVGIGTDGHTAGMLPQPADTFRDLFVSGSYVAGYRPDNKAFIGRVTTTVSWFQEQLDHAFVFAAGTRKCSVLQRLLNTREPRYEMPAQVIHDLNAEVFTDCRLQSK